MDVLYREFLRYDPAAPSWHSRDRFFLDPGHMSPMLYATLSLAGFYSVDDLKSFRQWGSVTPGHPERDVARGVENTSGPLGQGHAMALGAAIAERFMVARFGEWMAHKTYAYISDGGIQEEVSQGVGRIAGHLGLANFVMFYDANNVQLSTTVEEVDTENIAMKYEAWGWRVETIDGNDAEQIRGALRRAGDEKERPTLIIGHTLMAKGAVGGEGKVSTHGQPLTAAGCDFPATVKGLGGNPDDPFEVFAQTREAYAAARERLVKEAAARHTEEAQWREANPALAAKLDLFLSGRLPELDFSQVEIKADSATRAAGSAVLSYLADHVDNMIVASADLSNSDKTDGYLKKTKAFTKGDFSGKFFQPGVAEFTMACVMNGMALHGGVIPACGTFFVFSDYMKPAARMSALQRLGVKYVWSHDSFRVGEDGPTHQPVEHEAQIRLLEQLHNHRGERSMVVLRPADAREAVAAWKFAMECERPVGLIFSRQDVKSLPATGDVSKGAWVVIDDPNPDVVMLASGSEVATLVDGAQLLREKGVKVRVVSVPSEGLFRDQSADYQASILPAGVPRYGLTSGLPSTLAGLVEGGTVHGLGHFGYSAPYKVLDEKFGFSGAAVCDDVLKLLNK
jgi:transketolase